MGKILAVMLISAFMLVTIGLLAVTSYVIGL